MPLALVSLGSNLGDRRQRLEHALGELATTTHTRLRRRSRWYRSRPVGGPAGQGEFLNGAALLETKLPPLALLDELQRIEQLADRQREVRWSARTLDLDLLLYGDLILADQRLTLPHPRMACRCFVLQPAAEIAGALVHPASGWTVGAAARQLHRGQRIVIAAASPQIAEPLHAAASSAIRDTLPGAATLPSVEYWSSAAPATRFPADVALLLAASPENARSEPAARHTLQLPATGPVSWLTGAGGISPAEEAAAAVTAAFAPISVI